MPATTGDHMDRAFCRLYEQLKARAEAEGADLEAEPDADPDGVMDHDGGAGGRHDRER